MSDSKALREELGRVVREAWVRWAKTQPNPKPSWLVPYDDLPEPDKEADRQIGEAVNAVAIDAQAALLAEAREALLNFVGSDDPQHNTAIRGLDEAIEAARAMLAKLEQKP